MNNEFITVQQLASRIGASPEMVRRGIQQGALLGVLIRNDGRVRPVIPRKSVELFANTGITPLMLAQSVMQAETLEQGLAYLRAAMMEGI